MSCISNKVIAVHDTSRRVLYLARFLSEACWLLSHPALHCRLKWASAFGSCGGGVGDAGCFCVRDCPVVHSVHCTVGEESKCVQTVVWVCASSLPSESL